MFGFTKRKELSGNTKRIVEAIGFLIIFCAIALQIYYRYMPKEVLEPKNNYETYPQAIVKIKDAEFTVALAQSEERKEIGLSYLQNMPENRGMAFIYKEPDIYPFWMKDMNFDLDFIWVRNGKIIEVTPYVSSKVIDQYKITKPYSPVDTVIELNAGQIEANQIGVGDTVNMRYLNQ